MAPPASDPATLVFSGLRNRSSSCARNFFAQRQLLAEGGRPNTASNALVTNFTGERSHRRAGRRSDPATVKLNLLLARQGPAVSHRFAPL